MVGNKVDVILVVTVVTEVMIKFQVKGYPVLLPAPSIKQESIIIDTTLNTTGIAA